MLKNFRLNITFRVILIVATSSAAVLLWFETNYYISAGLVTLIVIYQTVQLVHYVELTNRKLTRFLESIRYSDFSRSFSDKKLGKSFQKLDESFQEVTDTFKQQRIEKQVQFRYLQTVVQHIGMGLILFNQVGKVELLNSAAKRILQVAGLKKINELSKVDVPLLKAFKELEGGERNVIRVSIKNNMMQLALHATTFRLRDDMYKLVSFQDINPELEEKEMEAWQNLTQVLAHEIMNSVTPIASLSDTVQLLISEHAHENEQHFKIDKEAINDVTEALETIENRSQGLIRFVNSYRNFTKVPEPNIKLFSVKELLQQVKNLNKGEAENQNIKINCEVDPESLELMADRHLTEQVLINLIKNAFRALKKNEDGIIKLGAEIASGGGVNIRISDNGPGIDAKNLNKIFIPFYSTKRPYIGGGSGIGLSLSRQIMRAQGGTLTVQSSKEEGTEFTMRF